MAGSKSRRDAKGLSDLDRAFCMEYLKDLNAVQAYIRARLPNKVSIKTAGVNGWKILQRPEIQELVREFRDQQMEMAGLTVHETLAKLRQVLMYDVRKLYHADGRPKMITELDDETAAAIVGVDVVTTGNAEMGVGEVRKYKLADRVAALDKAMKYHGLFERDNKQLGEAMKEITIKFVEAGPRGS